MRLKRKRLMQTQSCLLETHSRKNDFLLFLLPSPLPTPSAVAVRTVPGLSGKEGDRHGLRAALARVPAGFAGGAEFHVTGLAPHQLRGLQPHLLELAHGLARGRRAPSPTGVQEYL